MITGKKEELDQIAKTHDCPEHGHKLGVAWHAEGNCYVIRCAEDHLPEEVTEVKSRTKQFKAGELAPVGKGLSLLSREDLGSGAALSPEMVESLIAYANKYGLDAYRGHVMLMYGKPYIGIDGYLYYARKQNMSYSLVSRPLTIEERPAYRLGDYDHAWIAHVNLHADQTRFTGLGVVTQDEMTAMSEKKPNQLRSPVVAAHPWQLAQKRAEWQALRRAFPIGETEDNTNEERDKSSVS